MQEGSKMRTKGRKGGRNIGPDKRLENRTVPPTSGHLVNLFAGRLRRLRDQRGNVRPESKLNELLVMEISIK